MLTALWLKVDTIRVEAERLLAGVDGNLNWSMLVDGRDQCRHITTGSVVELGDFGTTATGVDHTIAVLDKGRESTSNER